MNNKGFMATVSVLIALLVSGIFIISLQPLVLSKAKINKNIEMFTHEKTIVRNGLERLFSVYNQDISSNVSVINYDDLNIVYNVKEVETSSRKIRRFVSSGDTFRINNKTDLTIDFYGDKINRKNDAYVKLEVTIYDLFEENQYLEPVYSEIIYLNDSWSTNIDFGDYGDYQISFKSTNISGLDVVIEYTEQSYRELKIIENNKKERFLIIENDVINKKLNKYWRL